MRRMTDHDSESYAEAIEWNRSLTSRGTEPKWKVDEDGNLDVCAPDCRGISRIC